MKSIKIGFIAAAMLFSFSMANAQAPSTTAKPLEADRQAVDNACKAEAATAGCGTEQVGTGMLKCIHAYKQAHKEFVISDACKASRQQLRTDRKALKHK